MDLTWQLGVPVTELVLYCPSLAPLIKKAANAASMMGGAK
jgi:hypothetical protein